MGNRWVWAGLCWGAVALGGCASEPPGFNTDDDDDDATASGAYSIIITEVMANPAGGADDEAVSDANGEWIELYNLGDEDVDLVGFSLTDASGTAITLESVILEPRRYVVLGNNDRKSDNGGVEVDYEYSDFTLGNEAESLTLSDPDGNEVDRIAYDKAPSGASLSLDPSRYDAVLNDKASNFCASTYSELDSGDRASPGWINDVCFFDFSVGDVIISEIMINPDAVDDSVGEYLELYNTTSSAILLDGWVLVDGDGDHFTISSKGTLEIGAKSYVVLGASANVDENGGVPVDLAWGSKLILKDDKGPLSLLAGDEEIDQVDYTQDGFSVPTGASLELDPGALNASDNDDPTSWCEASEKLDGGDKGSPGVENTACP